MHDTEITIGNKTTTTKVHPNAPRVVNFYEIKGGRRVYERARGEVR